MWGVADRLQQVLDGRGDLGGFGGGSKAVDDLAVPVEQEFCEIPLDGLGSQNAGGSTGQPVEKRVG